jgi:hypothetical protein
MHTHPLPATVSFAHMERLCAGIIANDIAEVHRVAQLMLTNNETCPTESAATLLKRAISNNASLLLKRALLTLPGVRPARLLDVAVNEADVELAENLIRRGANPTPEMLERLSAIKIIRKLYPPRVGNTRLMHRSDLDKALEKFDLIEARQHLTEAKRKLALETGVENQTDVDLWQSTTRPDIRSAILALGDDATLNALAKTRETGTSFMHDEMRGYKITNPALYQYLKSFPYRSEKHGFPVMYNEAAQFEGTDKAIACRHLSTKWLLERIENNNKFNYDVFADIDKIQANVASDIEQKYQTLVSRASENHVRKNSEWGQFAVEQFRALASTPRQENEDERAIHMLVETRHHAMAAELKARFKDDGTTSYIVHFYDPNFTVGDKRVAFNELQVDDLKDLAKLDLAALLPAEQLVAEYHPTAYGEPVTMMHILSPGLLNQNAVADTGRTKCLTSQSDVVTPDVLYHVIENGYWENLQTLQPKLTPDLHGFAPEQRAESLVAMGPGGVPAIYKAFQRDDAEGVEIYCGLARGEAYELQLLSAQTLAGVPGLHIALQQGHTKTAKAFCDAVLDSDLDGGYKVALLLAARRDGSVPGLHLAIQNNHLETIRSYCRTVLGSELLPGQKVQVLTGRREDGLSTMVGAVLLDKPGAISTIAEELKRSDLSKPDRLKVFASLWEDTDPNSFSDEELDLLSVQPKDQATVEAYRTAAAELGLIDEPVIQRILNAWGNASTASGSGSHAPVE